MAVEGDAEVDLDLPSGHGDVIDDEAHELLAVVEVELVDPFGDSAGEVIDTVPEAVVCDEFVALGHEVVVLAGQCLSAGSDVSAAPLDLGEFEEPGLVEVGEASPFCVGRFDLAVEPGQFDSEELIVGDGSLVGQGGLAGDEDVGLEEGGADLVEDEGVELVGADVTLRAAAVFAAGSEAVVVGAVVVAEGPVVAAVGAPETLAAGVNAAGPADDQAPQQPGLVGEAPGAELGVVPAHSLGGLEDVVGDDGGHSDGDPLFLGPDPSLLGAPPGLGRAPHGAVVVGPADVGLVAEEAPDDGGSPFRLAGGGGDAVDVEGQGDLADGTAPGDVVVEDSPDHDRFRLVDLEASWAVSGAGHDPVAIGRLPGNDLAGPGAVELAPPVALGDLGPLVLGDHTLDLGEETSLRVVQRRSIDEEDPHPEAFQFVEDHHLIGVSPGEAVGRQAPHRFDEPRLSGVPQGVQAGTVEAGSRIAVIEVLGDELLLLGGHPGPEHLELGADRALGLLGLAGDPGVERHPHCATSSVSSPPAAARTSSYPPANASRRGSACGVHGGRATARTIPTKTGSVVVGRRMSPASPVLQKRDAAGPTGVAPPSTAARNAS